MELLQFYYSRPAQYVRREKLSSAWGSRTFNEPYGIFHQPGADPQFPSSRQDRHRGGGHPPTPATPPCVRVRTRRFELVALTAIDQRRKSKRFEVSIGKPHREGLGPSQVPRATATASRVSGESRTDPQ